MVLPVIIFLCGLLSPAICDQETFTYTDNCIPPPGFNDTTGYSTPSYDSLLPIERCCPQCDECKDLGGSCILKWALALYPHCCDFSPVRPCKDYSCECCIRCADDTCSPCVQTGGECRVECRYDELEDTTHECAYSNNGTGCKCCKQCESTSECSDAQGSCASSPDDCPHGTYASTGCCGGCYCCKPVQEPVIGGICETKGGYCTDDGDCANGYYASFGECSKTLSNAGLETPVLGYCCIPKQTGSPGHGGRMAPFQHPRQLLF